MSSSTLSKLLRSLQNPRRVASRLKAVIDARVGVLLSRPRLGAMVMFHIGRSGSTVLGDLLDQHPSIYWDQEVYLGLLRKRDKMLSSGMNHDFSDEAVDFLRSRMALVGKEFYGFEVKFFHLKLLNISLSDYVEQLQGLGVTHFVILERKNYLRKVVSSIIAHKLSRAHQPHYKKAQLTRIGLDVDNVEIDFDAKPLISYLQDWTQDFRTLEQLLDGQKVLRLTYEDDVSVDPLVGYRRICDFIGVDQHQVSVRYGKTNPFKLTEIIINFDEVARVLGGTPFEWMLEG